MLTILIYAIKFAQSGAFLAPNSVSLEHGFSTGI